MLTEQQSNIQGRPTPNKYETAGTTVPLVLETVALEFGLTLAELLENVIPGGSVQTGVAALSAALSAADLLFQESVDGGTLPASADAIFALSQALIFDTVIDGGTLPALAAVAHSLSGVTLFLVVPYPGDNVPNSGYASFGLTGAALA